MHVYPCPLSTVPPLLALPATLNKKRTSLKQARTVSASGEHACPAAKPVTGPLWHSNLVTLHASHHSVWYGCNVQAQNILCQLIGDAGLSTSPYTPLTLDAHTTPCQHSPVQSVSTLPHRHDCKGSHHGQLVKPCRRCPGHALLPQSSTALPFTTSYYLLPFPPKLPITTSFATLTKTFRRHPAAHPATIFL